MLPSWEYCILEITVKIFHINIIVQKSFQLGRALITPKCVSRAKSFVEFHFSKAFYYLLATIWLIKLYGYTTIFHFQLAQSMSFHIPQQWHNVYVHHRCSFVHHINPHYCVSAVYYLCITLQQKCWSSVGHVLHPILKMFKSCLKSYKYLYREQLGPGEIQTCSHLINA